MKETLNKSDNEDRKGRIILSAAASLLIQTLSLVIVFNNQLKRPWYTVLALLLPAAETVFFIVNINALRSSTFASGISSVVLQIMNFVLFSATVFIIFYARAPYEVSLTLFCVLILWGGMVEKGLGLVDISLNLYRFYFGPAVMIVNLMSKEHESMEYLWLALAPIFLVLAMGVWNLPSINSKGESDIKSGDPVVCS